MKFLKLSLLFLLVCSSLGAEIQVSLHVNKIHCLFDFVDSISGNPDKTSVFKEVFLKSPFNNEKTIALLEEFNSIKNRSPNYQDSEMTIHCVQSDTISAFETNAKEFIVNDSQSRFFEIIRAFEPIYDQLIWNDNSEKLHSRKKTLEDYLNKSNAQGILTKISKFLCSNWSNGDSFKVFLYPIPGKNGSSRSVSLGNIQSIGIFVEEQGVAGNIGLIFHEICHSLMEAQLPDIEKAIFDYFKNSSSKYWFWTYCRLGEILATSIGNGWVFEQIIGSQDHNEWYHDKYIDGLAHGIFPEIKRYLNEGKTFDLDLAEKNIKLFEKYFPNSLNQFENIFCSILLISDGQDFNTREIAQLINRNFMVSGGIHRSSPIDHEKTFSLAKTTNSSVVLIIHEKHLPELERFIAQFEMLKEYKNKLLAKGTNYVFAMLDGSCKPFIIIKAADLKSVNDDLELIKAKKEVTIGQPFLVYQ